MYMPLLTKLAEQITQLMNNTPLNDFFNGNVMHLIKRLVYLCTIK